GCAQAGAIRNNLRHEKRETHADREAAGIERNAARKVAGGKPVRESLQPGHVGTGKSDSGNRPDQGRRPKTISDQAKQRGRDTAEAEPASNTRRASIRSVSVVSTGTASM